MLGMYVHTHWGYHRPYAARTWTAADWEGYLDGLSRLGYDTVMVWPLFDCMPPTLTVSDRDYLEILAGAIRTAQQRHGMRVVIVACPNTIGNPLAAQYSYRERPYFLCEWKVNPKSTSEVDAFVQGRREQFAAVSQADALAIIDSDPGGYVGSTRAEFVMLVRRQVDVFRSYHPKAEFVYWMLAGWENYNRFWARVQAHPEAVEHMWDDWRADEFPETLALLQRDIPEPWSALTLRAEHDAALAGLGMTAKSAWFPYGVIEGEPVFPLARYTPGSIAQRLTPAGLGQHPRGVMANAQTHCLQLPHTYLFAHVAQGGSMATADPVGFGDRLLPGHGEALATAWEALEARAPEQQRAVASRLQGLRRQRNLRLGDLSGLLFGSAERFVEDLALNLEVRATLTELGVAIAAERDVPRAVCAALACLRGYQVRVGFRDAYGGVLCQELNDRLAALHDPLLDRVLQDFGRWHDPRVRNGLFVRLLDAMSTYSVEA